MPGRGTHSGRGTPCVHNFRQNWLQLSLNLIYTRHGPGMCPAKALFDTFWFNLAPSGVRLGALGVPFRALGAVRSSFLVHFGYILLHIGYILVTASWHFPDIFLTVSWRWGYVSVTEVWKVIGHQVFVFFAFPKPSQTVFLTPLCSEMMIFT